MKNKIYKILDKKLIGNYATKQECADEILRLFGVIGSVCDCVIPKPKDPYHDLDRKICRDCNGNIEQTVL